jgi:hypothetical protein
VALGFNASATTANSIYLGNSAVNALYMGNGSAVAPAYVARAFVRFTYTAAGGVVIQKSGNVSSVTRNALGDYTIAFTTALPSNYAVAGAGNENGGGGGVYQVAINLYSQATATTTSCRITLANIDASGNTDPEVCSLVFVV